VRILYVVTTLGVGGAEKQVIDLAAQMAASGHVVALMALKHSEEEWPVKLPVLRLNLRKTPLGIWKGLRFARQFLVLFRPDILHSHTFPANLFARLLRLFGTHIASINTIHNVYEGGWHRMLIYRLTDPLTDRTTSVSTAAAERFLRFGAIKKAKNTVLTNGIDAGKFQPDRNRRKVTRGWMNADDEFVWLAVGRLVPAKDYRNLLHAFSEVRKIDTRAKLWIAGESDETKIRTLLTGFEDPGNAIQFLGLRRDIVDLLDAADGFVLSSAWEGMPLAVGEAMAMEKPVVATDVGGVRELLGEAGVLVPAKDSEALSKAMLTVMRMTVGERKSTGSAARQRIEQHFSIHAKSQEWTTLYSNVLAEKAG
jgi:glycosyltransferase involved in cell wall biosynthesis